jgi:transcriptional regulator with XRE-family HTH domain
MSDNVRARVGNNTKRLREAAGISQAKLAELLGMDRAYVSRLEMGKKLNPTIVTIWHVAQALGADVSELFRKPRVKRR